MLFKMALKNIKKSIKDYSIYFFTLVVAVCIFYIFNSLDAQESMLILSDSKKDIIKALVYILNYLSLFISIVLGFLIVYANNFLIKRRKKEFGLYLTMGMSKQKVSFILVVETLIIGLISLGIGLLLGIFLSQFLSVLTAKLFEVNMNDYQFIFSQAALIKTILYFGIIFGLVMIFNVFSISKNKLINLLTAGRKNEKVKIRNPFITVTLFIISVVLLVYAYTLLFNGALLSFDKDFTMMLISGALGTLLLFFSISGFFLKVLEKIKKIYYKDLNMFVLKQVNNKINTSVISTTIICLMLLFTIGILSGSISLINVFNSDAQNSNKTDFTIQKNKTVCIVNEDNQCSLADNILDLNNITEEQFYQEYVSKSVYYDTYNDPNLTIKDFFDQKTLDDLEKQYGGSLEINVPMNIMKESQYNQILEMYGIKDPIDLNNQEYILTAGIDKIIDYYKTYYIKDGSITINNNILKPANDEIKTINFQNNSAGSNGGTIIVDDALVENMDVITTTIIGNYQKNDNMEKWEKDFFEQVSKNQHDYTYITKLDMQETSVSLKAIIIFVGLYVGIIFAISSATILAIGQLSESSDNKERYSIIKDLGASDKMINKALLTQIAIAFLLPLIVALIHAFFGLKELNGIIEIVGDIDLSSNILVTALFIILVYGGYFIATYLCSKNIIKND